MSMHHKLWLTQTWQHENMFRLLSHDVALRPKNCPSFLDLWTSTPAPSTPLAWSGSPLSPMPMIQILVYLCEIGDEQRRSTTEIDGQGGEKDRFFKKRPFFQKNAIQPKNPKNSKILPMTHLIITSSIHRI